MAPPRRSELERIQEKIVVLKNGCWEWTGAKFTTGYGRFYSSDRSPMAHRAVYEVLVGAIPKGRTLDHVCHNEDQDCNLNHACPHRACVNPAHLEPVPLKKNILRGHGPAAKNAKRKTCRQGHPLSGDNLVVLHGKRRCRICLRAKDRATKASTAGKERSRQYRRTEKRQAYDRQYRVAHKEENRAYQSEYYQRHRQSIARREAAYREAHRDEIREYQRTYYQRTKQRKRELERQRLADPAARERRRQLDREEKRRKRAERLAAS